MVTHWDTAAVTEEGARQAVWTEGWDDATTEVCLDMLAPAFPPDARLVVEIGAGIGRLSAPFARLHPECFIIGVEPSPAMRQWFPTHWPNLLVWPYLPRGTYDGAYSMVTFQHLPALDQRAYVVLLASLLCPGGVFRFQWQTHGDTGPLAYPVPEATMVAWCESAGFEVTAVDHGFALFDAPWGWITAVRR